MITIRRRFSRITPKKDWFWKTHTHHNDQKGLLLVVPVLKKVDVDHQRLPQKINKQRNPLHTFHINHRYKLLLDSLYIYTKSYCSTITYIFIICPILLSYNIKKPICHRQNEVLHSTTFHNNHGIGFHSMYVITSTWLLCVLLEFRKWWNLMLYRCCYLKIRMEGSHISVSNFILYLQHEPFYQSQPQHNYMPNDHESLLPVWVLHPAWATH